MHADITRDSFNGRRSCSRVLLQQGRPITDADWNEQVELLVHQTRDALKSVVGWHATSDCGFRFSIRAADKAFHLCRGHYLVDGIRVVNEANQQLPVANFNADIRDLPNDNKNYLIYLDVWEQTLHAVTDPTLLEPALGGCDTSVRSQLRWALRVVGESWTQAQARDWGQTWDATNPPRKCILFEQTPPSRRARVFRTLAPTNKYRYVAETPMSLYEFIDGRLPTHFHDPAKAAGWRGLRIRTSSHPPESGATPCQTNGSPSSPDPVRIYRVEIHRGGAAVEIQAPDVSAMTATFKWSRENGIAVREVSVEDVNKLLLHDRKPNADFAPVKGDWVEVLNGLGDPVSREKSMLRVKVSREIDVELHTEYQVARSLNFVLISPEREFSDSFIENDPRAQPAFIRRWFPSGAVPEEAVVLSYRDALERITRGSSAFMDGVGGFVVNGPVDEPRAWTPLENGLEIQFSANHYQVGDYWLIVVRDGKPPQILGDPWSEPINGAVPPRGRRHYAPLGFLVKDGDAYHAEYPYRKKFNPFGIQYHICPTPPTDAGNAYERCDVDTSDWLPPERGSGENVGGDADEQPTPETDPAAPATNAAILSPEGVIALQRYFTTPREVLRRFPARYLKSDVTYGPLVRWLAPALVSQVAGLSFEQFDERFHETFSVPDDEREEYERDARRMLATAQEFSHMLSTEAGIKNVIA